MKKTTILFLLLAMTPLFGASVIRLGTLAPDGSSWHKVLQELAFRVKKETGGAVIVKIYAGGVVGDENEMIRKMRIGQLQAAAMSSAGLAEIEDGAFALSIPMMFDSYEEWDHVRTQINPKLEDALAAKGYKVLTWSDVGWLYFFSKQPMSNPSQLSAMKLAASISEPELVEILKWSGLNPVPISTVDLMTGLQTGLIDAMYMPLILAEGSQIYRQANHMLKLKWTPLQGAILISDKGWKSIPEKDQKTVMAIAAEIGEKLRQQTRDQEEASLQAMTSRGLKVHDPNMGDLKAWHESALRAYPKVTGRIVDQELFDKVVALRDAYRAAHP